MTRTEKRRALAEQRREIEHVGRHNAPMFAFAMAWRMLHGAQYAGTAPRTAVVSEWLRIADRQAAHALAPVADRLTAQFERFEVLP